MVQFDNETEFIIRIKTVWIQISWLLQKPADLGLHCFRIKQNVENVVCAVGLFGQIRYLPLESCFSAQM